MAVPPPQRERKAGQARVAVKRRFKTGSLWAGTLLFAAAYLAVRILIAMKLAQIPAVLTGLAVAGTIPFAARSRRLLRGALRGLGLGAAAAMGAGLAIMNADPQAAPFAMQGQTAVASTALNGAIMMICCTAAGALFGHLADRRHRRLYGDPS